LEPRDIRRRVRRSRIRTHALKEIGAVHRRRADPYTHLAPGRLGQWTVGDGEDLRSSKATDRDCFHPRTIARSSSPEPAGRAADDYDAVRRFVPALERETAQQEQLAVVESAGPRRDIFDLAGEVTEVAQQRIAAAVIRAAGDGFERGQL